MPARFDVDRLAKWMRMPRIALEGPKKKATFESLRGLVVLIEHQLNKGARKDWFLIAKSVGFRNKEGGAPLMIPGFVPTAEIAARLAEGQDASAIAKSVGAKKPNVMQAIAFENQWSGRSKAQKKAAPKTKTKAIPARERRKKAATALVAEVIALAKKGKALPAKEIRALRMGDGKPISKSLAAWLAFEVAHTPKRKKNRLVGASLEKVATDLAEHVGELGLEFGRLPGTCYVVMQGDEQVDFLYAGAPDADGEYPVLTFDSRELDVTLAAPGYDVWLAKTYELIGPETLGAVPKDYEKLMAEHARRNMSGKRTLSLT
jgi:hypothetical protein